MDARGGGAGGAGEPVGPYVSLTASLAGGAVSGFFSSRLAAVSAGGWADGTPHTATLSYVPGRRAVLAALANASLFVGGGAASAAALAAGGELAAVTFFLDGTAMLTAALSPEAWGGVSGQVYAGVTAANDEEGYNAVDVLSLQVVQTPEGGASSSTSSA
jgi:hypothetical protein